MRFDNEHVSTQTGVVTKQSVTTIFCWLHSYIKSIAYVYLAASNAGM